MIEIRSFRRVFDLERRIYAIDGMRLNPSGVPLRGVVYLMGTVVFAALLAAVLGALPLTGAIVSAIPWWLRDAAMPAALAAVLAMIRVDGRTFHFAARAQLKLAFSPRNVCGLSHPSRTGRAWRPPPLVVLPDGSDARPRALRFTGPGAVLVRAPLAVLPLLGRRSVRLGRAAEGARSDTGRVVVLRAGTRLWVEAGAGGWRKA